MPNIETDIEEEEEKRSFNIFGTNVAQVPCFRRSLLTGISGGLGCGVGYFLLTSNVRKAPHVAFASYMLITIGTWSICRYNWSMERFQERQIKKGLQTKIMYEGTNIEKNIAAQGEDV